MANKKDLLKDLSDLLKLEKPFTAVNLLVSKRELEKTVRQLKCYEKPHNFKPEGTSPERIRNASEIHTQYRLRMTRYIASNTGVKLPVNSLISCGFYNSIADYLGL